MVFVLCICLGPYLDSLQFKVMCIIMNRRRNTTEIMFRWIRRTTFVERGCVRANRSAKTRLTMREKLARDKPLTTDDSM